jgi:uncharacterized membrane protein YfcA
VPVYTLILHFPVKHAITLTSVTVLGGATANNLLNLSKRHPIYPQTRPCIDWDLIMMLEPMTIGGALLGAMLNNFLPAVVLVVMLLVLLLLTAYLTLQKAVKLYRKETIQKQLLMEVPVEEEQRRLVVVDVESKQDGNGSRHPRGATTSYGSSASTAIATVVVDDMEASAAPVLTEELKDFVLEENAHQVWVDALKLTALFGVVTGINLWKGDLDDESSSRFWTFNATLVLIIVGFMIWVRRSLLDRLRDGGPVISDILWNERNTVEYPVYAILAGVVAGLFGIGMCGK